MCEGSCAHLVFGSEEMLTEDICEAFRRVVAIRSCQAVARRFQEPRILAQTGFAKVKLLMPTSLVLFLHCGEGPRDDLRALVSLLLKMVHIVHKLLTSCCILNIQRGSHVPQAPVPLVRV